MNKERLLNLNVKELDIIRKALFNYSMSLTCDNEEEESYYFKVGDIYDLINEIEDEEEERIEKEERRYEED